MGNRNKYRICIGDQNRHSSLLTIVKQKNDVYIISSSRENQMKLSIHESGAGQTSFTSEYMKKIKYLKNKQRHFMKMETLKLEKRYEIICSYIFPENQIILRNKIEKQNVFWIDTPKKNEMVEISFCKATTFNFDFNIFQSEWNVAKTIVLEDKSIVLVFYRYVKMREIEYNAIEEAERKIISLKEAKGIEDIQCATVGYTDEHKRRYEMEVFA